MVARVTTLTDTVRRRPPLVAARASRGPFASAAGNRSLQVDSAARTTYAYDSANQTRYSQDGTGRTTFTFDSAGNQRIELSPVLARTTNVWDYENRRRAAIDPSTGATTFTYRPDALRVKSQDGSSTTKFIWDEQRVLTETDGSNASQVVYTSEPAGYGNLVSQRRLSGGIWTPYVHLYDALGSTDRLTDDTQAVANSYIYKAFGVLAASTGSVTNLAQFVGRLGYATQSAGTYVQARWYEPSCGRWLSFDPIRFLRGIQNLYSYVDGGPLINTDPSGLWTVQGVLQILCNPHHPDSWVVNACLSHKSVFKFDRFVITYRVYEKHRDGTRGRRLDDYQVTVNGLNRCRAQQLFVRNVSDAEAASTFVHECLHDIVGPPENAVNPDIEEEIAVRVREEAWRIARGIRMKNPRKTVDGREIPDADAIRALVERLYQHRLENDDKMHIFEREEIDGKEAFTPEVWRCLCWCP